MTRLTDVAETSRPASKRCCSSGVSGGIGADAPGFPGHSTRQDRRRARTQIGRRRGQRRKRLRLFAQARGPTRDRRSGALAEMRASHRARRERPGTSDTEAPAGSGRLDAPRSLASTASNATSAPRSSADRCHGGDSDPRSRPGSSGSRRPGPCGRSSPRSS